MGMTLSACCKSSGVEKSGLSYLGSVNTIIVSLLAVLLCCSFIPRPSWGQTVLTVNKALDLAMENNPAILGSQEKIEQAKAEIRGARAGLGPRLEALLSYVTVKETPKLPVYDFTGRPEGFTLMGYEDTWKAALKLTQVLYSGGSVQAGIEAAELQKDSVEALYTRTLQTVTQGVRKAFFGLQRYRAQLGVVEESVSLAQEHLKQAEAFYRNGVVAQNEVLRVEVAVSSAKLDQIRVNNAVDTAWKALERAVGISLQGVYSLEDPSQMPSLIGFSRSKGGVSGDRRPEIASLNFQKRAAEALARVARGQLLPQVALEAQVHAMDDSFFPEDDNWSVGLAMQWVLGDSGKTQAKIAEAKSLARQLIHGIEDLHRQINLEIASAELSLHASEQMVSVAEAQVASAEEDYRMALRRYAAQVGTNIDVLDARVALQQARTSLVNALYDGLMAWSELFYATGVDPYLDEIQSSVSP